MMVKSSYFYDITLTMATVTFSKSWTVRPDQIFEQDRKLIPFEVSSVSIDLDPHQRVISIYPLDIALDRVKRFVYRGCPIEFFTILINSMMNIPAKIKKDSFGNFSVVIETFYHMKRHIDEAIQKMIDRSFFTDLSFDDANKIILRLNLAKFLYCFEGHESGVCLVVLGPNVSTQRAYEQPWELFQKEVQKFNDSRTIYMTPEQEKRLVTDNEDFRKLVEFTSSVNKTTRKVVFKNNDFKVEIIRQMLEVEKLTEQLSIATAKLQNMRHLEETLELQRRMFHSE